MSSRGSLRALLLGSKKNRARECGELTQEIGVTLPLEAGEARGLFELSCHDAGEIECAYEEDWYRIGFRRRTDRRSVPAELKWG